MLEELDSDFGISSLVEEEFGNKKVRNCVILQIQLIIVIIIIIISLLLLLLSVIMVLPFLPLFLLAEMKVAFSELLMLYFLHNKLQIVNFFFYILHINLIVIF